jgi:hypothetical protein
MKHFFFSALVALLGAISVGAAESEAGFVKIFDGKSFEGWRFGDESAKSWRIEDGALVAQGARSHAFYVGDGQPFKDFELKVDVMTEPGSSGGIYFHTKYQESGWPKAGFECQVNVSQSDWITVSMPFANPASTINALALSRSVTSGNGCGHAAFSTFSAPPYIGIARPKKAADWICS